MALPTIGVKDKDGADVTVNRLNSGRQAAADSSSSVLSTEDLAAINAITTALTAIDGRVDGLETLITSTNTKLDTAITALQIIDNMVLAAGTNYIGKTRLTDGTNDIALVDAAVSASAFAIPVAIHPDSVNANGQTTMSASASVTIASDQTDIPVNPKPATSGGLSIFRSIDLDEGTLEVVKASAGQVYGMWITNTATATRFVKFYNATSGTYGTGTPVITIGIPGNTSDDVSGLFSSTHGIAFSTGICVGAGTGVADNDTGAPGANEVIINVFYK